MSDITLGTPVQVRHPSGWHTGIIHRVLSRAEQFDDDLRVEVHGTHPPFVSIVRVSSLLPVDVIAPPVPAWEWREDERFAKKLQHERYQRSRALDA